MSAKKYTVSVKAAADGKPAEILVHGPIGRSFWSEDGITGKEFIDELNKIPVGTKVIVGVNSQGGAYGEGVSMFHAIERRREDVTVRIDGYALSIASYFPLAASKVISPESSIWMIHNTWNWIEGSAGNAADMRKHAELALKNADMLEKHDERLAAAYAKRTGKSEAEIRAAMEEETWLTGAEAVEWGLADELGTNEADLYALDFSGANEDTFKKIEIKAAAAAPRNIPKLIISAAAKGEQKTKSQADNAKPITSAAAHSTPAPKQGAENHNKSNTMRNKLIALLNSRGVEVNDSMTDEQLLALVENGKPQAAAPAPQNTIDINGEIQKAINAERTAIRRESEATRAVSALVAEKRITQAQADKALPAIIAFAGEIKDSPVLAALRENPIMQEPAEPVAADSEITGDASVADICNGIKQCNDAMKSWQRGNSVSAKALAKASVRRAEIINQHAKKLHGVLAAGTNTIDAALQRDVILQSVIVDFARRLLPLQAFSTVFQNVPLEGTNKVQVPFFDLDSGSSTSFKGSDGYVAGDTASDNREIQIGKRADSDVADNTKQYDRKYQALSFTSEELARQPYLNVVQLARLKAEKLASDIIAHVLSIVTQANFGDPGVTKPAALFTSDDVADLKLACKAWPEMGRSLILDSAYDAALLKDGAIKGALNYGGSEAIRQGRIPELFGFSYREIPTIPSNSENLVGFATFVSAILFAQAPVPPTEEVRRDGTAYSIITDPATGIAFEYRTFGNSQADKAVHIIEASYGFAKGNGNALKRIVSGNA